jgi:hypothetical protein
MPIFNKPKTNSQSGSILSAIVGIVLFGSIWGLLDAVSTGALFLHIAPFLKSHHVCVCALTSATFGGFIMALALRIYRRPAMLIGIGAVAALFKLLNFAILPLPIVNGQVVYQPVVNPALAAFVVSLVFALIGGLLLNKLEASITIRVGAGALAGFLGAVAYVYAAFYLTSTHPLIVNTPLQYIIPLHGPASAVLGAIFFPLGYSAAIRVQPRIASLLARKLAFRYGVSAGIVAFCVGISALSLAAF